MSIHSFNKQWLNTICQNFLGPEKQQWKTMFLLSRGWFSREVGDRLSTNTPRCMVWWEELYRKKEPRKEKMGYGWRSAGYFTVDVQERLQSWYHWSRDLEWGRSMWVRRMHDSARVRRAEVLRCKILRASATSWWCLKKSKEANGIWHGRSRGEW